MEEELQQALGDLHQGSHHSTGVFTLDPIKAREKLGKFRLAEPEQHLLKIFQAAVAGGASRLECQVARKQIEIRFSGPQVFGRPAELVPLLEQPKTVQSRALRHLVIGLEAAVARGYQELIWSIRAEGVEERLLVTRSEVRVEVQQAPEVPLEFRLSLRGAHGIRGLPAKLLQACRFSPIPVSVNGKLPNRNWDNNDELCLEGYKLTALEEPHFALLKPQLDGYQPLPGGLWYRRPSFLFSGRRAVWLRHFQGPDGGELLNCEYAVRFPLKQTRLGSLEFVCDGVALPGELYQGNPVAEVIVCGDRLSTDLSGFSIVRDRFYDEFRQSLDCYLSSVALMAVHEIQRVGRGKSGRSLRTNWVISCYSETKGDPNLGRPVGEWRLLERLEESRWGPRYQALGPEERLAEVILMFDVFYDDPEFRERVQREIEVWSRVSHPNVNSLLDWGEAEGKLYMVQSSPPGHSLNYWSEHAPLSQPHALECLRQVGEGLSYLHSQGVVHRQLSLDCLRWCVTGRATIVGPTVLPSTHMGHWDLGNLISPAYMAPETVQDAGSNPKADQYSLAVIGYELLTGKLPFQYEEPMQMLLAHLNEEPPPPEELPPHMAEALLRALAKVPEERFDEVLDFTRAL